MKAGKRILFVSQTFPPDVTAGAFRIRETAVWLKRFGFEVTVLTAWAHREQAEEGDEVSVLEGIRVVRAPIIRIGDRGGIWYLLQFLSFMVTAFLWGLICTPARFHYVIASSPPLFVGVSSWLLAKLKRAKFVLDVRDLWPDSAVATGQLPAQGMPLKAGRWLERFLYQRARLITCVSKVMQDVIKERVGGHRRVEVVYNGADVELAAQTKKSSGTAGDQAELKTIVYAGNLGRSQGLEVLIKAANEFPEVQFRLIGGGVRKRALEELSRQLELENVQFLGPYPKQKVLALMSEASALFLHLKDDPVFATTIPSKVFDYLRVNRPILYGIRGEGAELLGSLPGNIPFEPDNVDSLVQAISKLKTQYPHYLQLAQQNSYLLLHFTREAMARKLFGLLEAL